MTEMVTQKVREREVKSYMNGIDWSGPASRWRESLSRIIVKRKEYIAVICEKT